MNKKQSLLLVATLFTMVNFSSCAALMRYKCNREYAAKKGMDDAANARTSMPARLEGNSCDGDYSASDFSKDYNYGFQQKKNEICAPASAAAWGRQDGEAGNAAQPQKTKLGMCDDKKLLMVFDAEFKKAFCAPARATKLGSERAQSWQPADYETAFHDCGSNKTLKNAYNNAYRDTLANNCTVGNAEKSAMGEANARRAPEAVRARLETCPASTRGEILGMYDKTFNARKLAIEKEDAAAAAAAAAAARKAKVDEFQRYTATTSFTFQLRTFVARCNVSGDKSYVAIEVENPYPDQILIQGNWKLSYYNFDFAKITEDRTQEALLVTGNNRKTFQKMTLPRDANFCRAEYIGANTN